MKKIGKLTFLPRYMINDRKWGGKGQCNGGDEWFHTWHCTFKKAYWTSKPVNPYNSFNLSFKA